MTRRHIRIVLQARTSSSRLPAKVLLPLGGFPLAILCAKRLQRTGIELILATSEKRTDDILATLAERFGIRVFRGSLTDVLSRFVACTSDLFNDDIVVRMTADNPVPDGTFVHRLVHALIERNAAYCGTQSPQDGLPYGLSGEAFTVGALREADAGSKTSFEREHVTPFLRACVGVSGIIEKGYFLEDNLAHLRCTVDTLGDYIFMASVFNRFSNPIDIDWQTLLPLLPESPKQADCNILSVRKNGESFGRVMLGTAQFGMDYGITNRTGYPSDDEVQAIIQTALSVGVSYFDTARTYGNAEARIGHLLAAKPPNTARIITKLAPLTGYADNTSSAVIAQVVDASVFRSCHALQRQCIDVMMFHRCADMFRWHGAALERLTALVDEGVIGELGVSVYTPAEAIQCMADARIQHIQIPFNILDVRWLSDEFQAALGSRTNLKIHARSVFLQGLLINEHTVWPKWFTTSEYLVSQISQLCVSLGRKSAADLCMAYVSAFPWVTTMVLGVERLDQLEELLSLAFEPPLSQAEVQRAQATFRNVPDRLLNPGMW